MNRRLRVLAPLRVEASAARRGATSATVERTGMGPRRSQAAIDELAGSLDAAEAAAIVGFCGSLADDLAPGDVVVASAVRSADGAIDVPLPGAGLLAAELRRAGLAVNVGPIVSAGHVVKGSDRNTLAASSGAIAVDMESAWLAAGAGDRPVAVVRVVVDTPHHELVSVQTPRRVHAARRAITTALPSLERWAAASGARDVVLATPRSFCAGVERAIEIVERAIDRFGAPVYVRRQIVHNAHVVAELEARGAVFIDELDEVPSGATTILAAHGVSPDVRAAAAERELEVIDATCPLVAKVHAEARRFAGRGYDIVLVGHRDHEEVEGTVGEAPERITVVGSIDEVDAVEVDDPERVAFLTQTTLAVDEVAGIVDRLRSRFPALVGPNRDDICYATQNRQEAVAAIASGVDVVVVVGSANSSNSRRLTEVAARHGARSYLVDGAADLELAWLAGASTVGVTAGASAPESKVQEVVAALRTLGPVSVIEHTTHDEDVTFQLPIEVRS